VKETDGYPHMPILHPTNGAALTWRLRRRISMDACGWAWLARWPIRPILSKVYKNLWFFALDADEPPCKILRR